MIYFARDEFWFDLQMMEYCGLILDFGYDDLEGQYYLKYYYFGLVKDIH
jgi:hypothetical protein